MSNFLELAQISAEARNWSQLTQALRQLPLESQKIAGAVPSDGLSDSLSDSLSVADVEKVLALALEVLAWGDFQERWDVTPVFLGLGTAAIPQLVIILEDEEADIEQRWFAARILGELKHPTAIQALVTLLQTSDSEDLGEIAANALANLGATVIDSLADLIQEPHSRGFATAALVQIRHPDIIPLLLSVVNDTNADIRASAIAALSNFPDSRIPPILIAALKDPVALVRKEAVIGLGVCTCLPPELDRVSLLQPLLWDLRLEVCQQAAMALSRVGTEAAATALREMLLSPLPPLSLKIEAVRALSWIETKTALEFLKTALLVDLQSSETPQRLICQEIITVLGRVQNSELKGKATEILLEVFNPASLKEQDFTLKQAFALALGQLGELAALTPLIQLLADSDTSVQFHGIAALKQLAPDVAYQHLTQLAAQEDLSAELKSGITLALQEWRQSS